MGSRLQCGVFSSLVEQTNKMGLEINEKRDEIYDVITKTLE